MPVQDMIQILSEIKPEKQNTLQEIAVEPLGAVRVYPNSIHTLGDNFLFIGWHGQRKYLWMASRQPGGGNELNGKEIPLAAGALMQCSLSHENAVAIRQWFDFARPVPIGLDDSFGFGDRLGIANPAHVRAAAQFEMRPIFAQQSIRELERTQREADEVMDAATWAVFQEGYKDGFGADADHLKTTADFDRMVRAGFTFFTIDPSEYVQNDADVLSVAELAAKAGDLPWQELQDDFETLSVRYEGQTIRVADDFTLQPNREMVLRAMVKYGRVIAHTAKLYRYMKETYPEHPAEFELSVDETDSVTSPFEHFFVASELKRLGVPLISLAPRFIGEFEKGIDYKGDIDVFKTEYLKHVKIAEKLGPYKISIHSGSDKFRVYEAIGSLQQGHVHVKTAGTSYLEALRTVAATEPALFREILDFSRARFEVEKATYHVSARLENVPAADRLSDGQLLELFGQDDARQVLHVTFGKVLTTTEANGKYLFKGRIMQCLTEHEDVHYENLQRHFIRHLQPFVAGA